MTTSAHGRILFWEGANLWILEASPGQVYPRTAVHSHHVIQVTLALSGRLDFESGSARVTGVAIAVAPDVPHSFQATGLIVHLFVAPDSRPGRAIVRALFAHRPIVSLPDLPARLRARFEAPHHTDDELRALGRDLVSHLAGIGDAPRPADPRIEKVIGFLTASVDQPVSLNQAAAMAGLSPGRTRHLFVQQTGLPFRTFLLWLRLNRALELFAGGSSLTEAAHAACFSDSAHLSRTFRRMFGITAASLQLS